MISDFKQYSSLLKFLKSKGARHCLAPLLFSSEMMDLVFYPFQHRLCFALADFDVVQASS